MKKHLYLLLSILIISCSSDDDHEPSFTVESYTAEIGDLITITGNNLGSVRNVRIFNEDFSIPAVDIFDEPRSHSQRHFFTSQSETEIQFILPEVYAESYIMRVGGQDIPLNVKGFIPLVNVLDYREQGVTGIKVVDEDKALGRSEYDLYLLGNSYHDEQLLSRNVPFFDVLDNGDSWYARSSDNEFYEIFYNEAGTSSYHLLTSFNRMDLNENSWPNGIAVNSDKQVFISIGGSIAFVLENNEIKKDIELFPGLEEYSRQERNIYSFQLTPAGTLYGKLNNVEGFLILDPSNYTFAFTEEFTSDIEGPEFRGNVGYIILPWENRLYKSTDSGVSWNESSTPTPIVEGNLRNAKMNVLDENTVMLFIHSSRDQNFPYTIAYITRDGGNTWQERKRFDEHRQSDKQVSQSDFRNGSGLFYFIGGLNAQMWKYVH